MSKYVLCWIFSNIRRINSCFRYVFPYYIEEISSFQSIDEEMRDYKKLYFFLNIHCFIYWKFISFIIPLFIGKWQLRSNHSWILTQKYPFKENLHCTCNIPRFSGHHVNMFSFTIKIFVTNHALDKCKENLLKKLSLKKITFRKLFKRTTNIWIESF